MNVQSLLLMNPFPSFYLESLYMGSSKCLYEIHILSAIQETIPLLKVSSHSKIAEPDDLYVYRKY